MSMDGFKKQMALINYKSRREAYKDAYQKLHDLNAVDSAIGQFLRDRIAEMDQQIKIIEQPIEVKE